MAITGWLEFGNSKLSFDRSIWSYGKLRKLVSAILRERRIQLRRFANVQYVNLGCGTFPMPGFYNVDYDWCPGVLCWDVTKGLPFSDSSMQGIFSEHCLEHISYDKGVAVLRELRRILCPGGVVRLIVPDGELYCRLYLESIEGGEPKWPYPERNQTAMGYVNRIMRGYGHQFIYDFPTLRKAMLEVGFREVCKAAYREGREPKLLVDQEHRAPESLYVEGIA